MIRWIVFHTPLIQVRTVDAKKLGCTNIFYEICVRIKKLMTTRGFLMMNWVFDNGCKIIGTNV